MAKQPQQRHLKGSKDATTNKIKVPVALFDKGDPKGKREVVVEEAIPATDKVARLFTYLEKALALDDTVIRDFRPVSVQPSPWWIADLPNDAENLSIRTLETDKTNEGTNEIGDIWLRVEKKNIEVAPDVPKVLREWVENITPLTPPTAKEKIDRKIKFDHDSERVQMFRRFRKEFKQGDKPPALLRDWVILDPSKYPEVMEEKYEEDRFVDHSELKNLLEAYVENEWRPWATKVLKTYKANLLYDHLYALRLLLKNEGDSYEILWGHNVLTWSHQAVGAIYSPIFLTPMTLEFDATKRVMVLSPDPMLKGFVELTALHEMNNRAEMDLITWADRINASPFDFWHYQSLKTQSRFLVNNLSPDGVDEIEETTVANPPETKLPTVWNAPVIFARKRTNDLWSKYAGLIRRDLEQSAAESTPFIRDLVGDYDDSSGESEEDGDEREVTLKDSDLYFPLPWNDEQKRIAERLDAHYGVVVKGPPGTGKSHTIANLISRCLAQGQTVLVTSQTSKALEVLRDKLPQNIRSLAVSQLSQTARRDDVLQQSIGEISSNLGERHTKFDESKSDRVRTELRQVRQEKASLGNDIRKFILTDSQVHIVIDGVEIKPMDAARFLAEHADQDDLAWFTDAVPHATELDFTKEDMHEAFAILKELDINDRQLHCFELPTVPQLPPEDAVIGAFKAFRDYSAQAKASGNAFKKTIQGLDRERLLKLWHMLNDARNVLQSIGKKYEREIFEICAMSPAAREQWRTVLEKIAEKIKIIGVSSTKLLGHDISGNLDLPVDDLQEAASVLKRKVAGGTRIGTLTKLLLSSNAKRTMESYRVDGKIPDTAERVEALYHKITIEQAQKDIKTLLRQGFANVKASPEVTDTSDVVQMEVLVTSLGRMVSYCDSFAEIGDICKKTKQLSEFSYTKLADVERLIEYTSSDAAKYELANLVKTFDGWIDAIDDNGVRSHATVASLISAIQKRSVVAWKKAMEELSSARDKKQKAIRLDELSKKIGKHAPNLYSDIVGLADQSDTFQVPNNLPLAWKIARLGSWLNEIHDGVDIDVLQARLERLTQKEYQLNSELVTILAWQRQIDRVSKRQRDALMAWSLAMKKYGKGTGKYALTHLHAAQEALKEAKSAVPVWIMPLHRVAQMFSEPQPGMFDVVIFDEASQCDIKGITIGYLGKKLLVVGDPEQISPAGIFQNQEKVFELISRFLNDIPFKETFSVTSSLFDIAKIRLSNIIQLNEHFRSVPEIIAFSNHHIYEGKLKPLRYPNPKGMLKPALVPVFVKEGYQNTNGKVNEPEAQAIVAKLIQCLNDPHYQLRPDGKLCTFGIISLLAEDQAKFIVKLLRNEIAKGTLSEKTMEERHIEVGDAYKFQGDERDVIFLSMVRALDSNDPNDTVAPLTNEDAKRRFNVAASRARDQMFLFHSIPIEALSNKSDWRYKLLAWFYDPKAEELNAGRAALKKEFDSGNASQFSFDVGNLLIDRGYQVIPEYPVIGYRIDLVIQGAETRLAVECDGDQYHTLERWEEDQAREQQLRRAGWIFWRVTGSAFYRHKEHALDSLWAKLRELDIRPLADQ